MRAHRGKQRARRAAVRAGTRVWGVESGYRGGAPYDWTPCASEQEAREVCAGLADWCWPRAVLHLRRDYT
jgi:hypothetical protein